MIDRIQFKDPNEAKKAADNIMDVQDTTTDNVWKRGELIVIAPTQNNFNKQVYDRLQKGEPLSLQDLKEGLSTYAKTIFRRASVMFVAMPDGLTLNEIKCRYTTPPPPQLVAIYHVVANAFFNTELFPNGLK